MPAPARLTALLLWCATASLDAQSDSTARIQGVAKSAFNGRPLAGVMVAVPAARRFVVTDSTGTFRLTGLPAGRQKVRIAYEGRETEEFEFDLRRGKALTVTVVLDVAEVDLAPIVVEARSIDVWRDLAGFYERRRWYSGFAKFYTREDLERWHPATIGMVLAQQGIYTRCLAGLGCVPGRASRGVWCAVGVSVDGLPFWEDEYDRIPIEDVAGIEIYRNDVGTPWGSGITVGTWMFDAGERVRPCGSVQIWTR